MSLMHLTALEVLSDRSNTAHVAHNGCRDAAESSEERMRVDMKSYHQGESVAYLEARQIMDRELRRLCNRFQNGCLSIDDFGIVL